MFCQYLGKLWGISILEFWGQTNLSLSCYPSNMFCILLENLLTISHPKITISQIDYCSVWPQLKRTMRNITFSRYFWRYTNSAGLAYKDIIPSNNSTTLSSRNFLILRSAELWFVHIFPVPFVYYSSPMKGHTFSSSSSSQPLPETRIPVTEFLHLWKAWCEPTERQTYSWPRGQ